MRAEVDVVARRFVLPVLRGEKLLRAEAKPPEKVAIATAAT